MSLILKVEVSDVDRNRVANRIKMLDGVESVLADEREERKDDEDIHVWCQNGVSRFDVEELLLGVAGVKVKVVS
jgi:hypothetical protein